MKTGTMAILLSGLAVFSALATEQKQVEIDKRVPFLEQRLHSTRWEVRYYLTCELVGRDGEARRTLESLILDKHQGVANQALVRYLNNFVTVDKRLFAPNVYVPGRFPVTNLPDVEPNKALVDYCLGRREIAPKGGYRGDDTQPILGVLDPKKRDDPAMYESLTIVGILGQPDDAPFLHPFLESTNDYVLVGAAKALLRLGDKTKAMEALSRLTEKDPKKHLYYITEALYVLKEVEHPKYIDMILRVLATVDKTEGIQPNWLNSFLFLASDVKADVWK